MKMIAYVTIDRALRMVNNDRPSLIHAANSCLSYACASEEMGRQAGADHWIKQARHLLDAVEKLKGNENEI